MVYGCWIGVHRRTDYKVLSPYRPENQLYISTNLTNGLSDCQPEKQGVWKVIFYCEYTPSRDAEWWICPPICIVDAEFCTFLCSGCCIPIFLNEYSDFPINITKSGLGVPWRRCQNTQSMLFPCLFREYMGHIFPLLWGTRYPSLMPPIWLNRD